MTAPIDFYFDFSSPYGYFASFLIDGVGERTGHPVNWRPYLIGAAFKQTGGQPLINKGIKSDYALHDFQRLSRELDVPITFPTAFPQMTVAACRAFYWVHDRDPALAKKFAHALYAKIFGEGADISGNAAVAAVAQSVGIDPEELTPALHDAEVKQRLRGAVDDALAAGVFGSPYFVIDGEPFWGTDRIAMLERWITTGGW